MFEMIWIRAEKDVLGHTVYHGKDGHVYVSYTYKLSNGYVRRNDVVYNIDEEAIISYSSLTKLHLYPELDYHI